MVVSRGGNGSDSCSCSFVLLLSWQSAIAFFPALCLAVAQPCSDLLCSAVPSAASSSSHRRGSASRSQDALSTPRLPRPWHAPRASRARQGRAGLVDASETGEQGKAGQGRQANGKLRRGECARGRGIISRGMETIGLSFCCPPGEGFPPVLL
ncbi:hypothetical protein HDV57DRAFT_45708 [Trichoderma longibrachiatum]